MDLATIISNNFPKSKRKQKNICPKRSKHQKRFQKIPVFFEKDVDKPERICYNNTGFQSKRRHSQAVRQRSAKPLSPVRFRVAPPKILRKQDFFVFRKSLSPKKCEFLKTISPKNVLFLKKSHKKGCIDKIISKKV